MSTTTAPTPTSLTRPISPPVLGTRRKKKKMKTAQDEENDACKSNIPSSSSSSCPSTEPITPAAAAGGAKAKQEETLSLAAAIEAGRTRIEDHVGFFSRRLGEARRRWEGDDGGGGERRLLGMEEYGRLYARNEGPGGRHFVVHQHEHPVAGVHYDLRLQFSETSTVSFAIPYGLPGDPNAKSSNRLAIETRVHTLWNNLIESASSLTGSLLIWDTGEYTVLPRHLHPINKPRVLQTDSESSADEKAAAAVPENEKLIHAFRSGYIRLRLHGTRLPPNYTITMRLPSHNSFGRTPSSPAATASAPRIRKRGRSGKKAALRAGRRAQSTDDDDPAPEDVVSRATTTTTPHGTASDDEDDAEDAAIRLHNAYPGARNSIGSVHQRPWLLALDKRSSGFVLRKKEDGKDGDGLWTDGFAPFVVGGAAVERSVVTGRRSREVFVDEGVVGFVGRREGVRWRGRG